MQQSLIDTTFVFEGSWIRRDRHVWSCNRPKLYSHFKCQLCEQSVQMPTTTLEARRGHFFRLHKKECTGRQCRHVQPPRRNTRKPSKPMQNGVQTSPPTPLTQLWPRESGPTRMPDLAPTVKRRPKRIATYAERVARRRREERQKLYEWCDDYTKAVSGDDESDDDDE